MCIGRCRDEAATSRRGIGVGFYQSSACRRADGGAPRRLSLPDGYLALAVQAVGGRRSEPRCERPAKPRERSRATSKLLHNEEYIDGIGRIRRSPKPSCSSGHVATVPNSSEKVCIGFCEPQPGQVGLNLAGIFASVVLTVLAKDRILGSGSSTFPPPRYSAIFSTILPLQRPSPRSMRGSSQCEVRAYRLRPAHEQTRVAPGLACTSLAPR
jgi:hypothetical protein